MTEPKESSDKPPDYLTPDEVTELCGAQRAVVDVWRRFGRDPSGVKVDGQKRYDRAQMLQWIEAHIDPNATEFDHASERY